MTARNGLQWSMGAAGPVFAALDTPQSWPDLAACAEADPEVWYPEKGGSTREAKQVCRGCDVRAECLLYALEHDERWGIWGGLSEIERRRVKREAPRDAWPALIAELIRRQGEKTCTACGGTFPLAAFRPAAEGRTARCRACLSVKAAA
jgi:WhiB family transcriptional regulator, redox-sensing transcriptional regulator